MTDRIAFRAALQRIREAYASGNAETLLGSLDDASACCRTLRTSLATLEAVYPLHAFLRFAEELDREIEGYGLREGCRKVFDRSAMGWEHDVPDSCREIAEDRPVVFFGNHPSLMTPFLVAAALERSDLRCFTTSYACRLIPSFGRLSYPMEVPLTRAWTEWRRGGWKRVLAHRLAALVHDVPSADRAKAINRQGLDRGANHVRAGGGVMIFPTGGGERDNHWYPGIGALVKRLRDGPRWQQIYLVPVREENCSNRRLYAELSDNRVSRLKRAIRYRGPVRIALADPIPLNEIASQRTSIEQIVALLRQRYEALFAKPVLET